MKWNCSYFVSGILSTFLFTSCATQSGFRANDGATAAIDKDSRDPRVIELRFRVRDKQSGNYIGGWQARIDAYALNNKAAAYVVSEDKEAGGKIPTAEFRLTSGEDLPPGTGYRVYLKRHRQPGITIDMMDYFERISISKDITYRLD